MAALPPDRKPANESNFHSQQGKLNQHAEYHQISKSWHVPRTPLEHLPHAIQKALRQGHPVIGVGAARQQHPARLEAHKLISVLEFETSHGYSNCIGRSGVHFAVWTGRALAELAAALKTIGEDPELSQRCEYFAHHLRDKYAHLDFLGRGKAVQQTLMVVQAAELALDLATRKVGRTTRYVPPVREAVLEAAALEAHDEETTVNTAESNRPLLNGSPGKQTAALLPEPPEYVMVGKRKVKADTLLHRQQFLEAAAALGSTPRIEELGNGEQRTAQWLNVRERRLTASAFSKALGFFHGDRLTLWEEKIGVRAPFAGNEATRWGTRAEPLALQTYEAVTGQHVQACMFKVKHDDAAHSWLGASPDGLISALSVDSQPGCRGPGVVEIKCPYNKGAPESATPPPHAIWYYMPQVQGLMDIFDREWCELYIWTPVHGSATYHINRDRAYWAAAFEMLSQFWWAHVVPARQAREQGATLSDLEQWRPANDEFKSVHLKDWSKRMALAASARFYQVQSDLGGDRNL